MKYVLIGAIAIVVIFLIVLALIPKGIEPLTELYFENHTALTKYAFLDKDYNFSFTVHNLEYTPMEYEYVIEAFDKNNTLLFELDRNKFNLSDNESITLNENFTFKSHFENAKISILLNKLTSGNEINAQRKFWWKDENYPNSVDIHFWVEEITGPKITIIPD
ncbi:MAG: DUF1616 domain-containing protein [Nanoarchaeota archaeon]